MYKIDEGKFSEKYILLVPAMLDDHFPLLKYAFFSKEYHPVILDIEEGITEEGLRYINNDMCYPCILNAGQMIAALKSGKYDPSKTLLLMPTAGDACRGSQYLHIIQEAVKKAGFPSTKVISINLQGLEKGNLLKITPAMAIRALFALYYGDILMLLRNQLRPNEVIKGSTENMWSKWIDALSEDFCRGKNLSVRKMKKNFIRICEDFSKIELISQRKQRVGIVGELYIKYCHLGNWDMVKFLEANNCESHTNGLTWYLLYYLDSHLAEKSKIMKFGYKMVIRWFENLQNAMIDTLKKYNFYTLENLSTVKKEASKLVSHDLRVGDGWLIGSEALAHVQHDCPKVLAVQPFGCMANQCCGRGIYPHLNRNFEKGQIISVDVDSSGSQGNVYNRVKLLIDYKPLKKGTSLCAEEMNLV